MANRKYRKTPNVLLSEIRAKLKTLSYGDRELLLARRKVFKELHVRRTQQTYGPAKVEGPEVESAAWPLCHLWQGTA